eukprot:TRINITY_DN922_c0_g1_i1.p1 TRINITY_DN922_c0_g1~~TRINITY_DN922_c0_g1_i1.p1  ORF type:complete len:690 (+),score=184.46 TRINITY_DN922_c0_g1_i1:351-2420(+)
MGRKGKHSKHSTHKVESKHDNNNNAQDSTKDASIKYEKEIQNIQINNNNNNTVTEQGTVTETSTTSQGRSLSHVQESHLKNKLLHLTLQSEFAIFYDKPTAINDTLFLSYLRSQFLEFPLLKERQDAQTKLDELLMSIPQFSLAKHRATKKEKASKFKRMVVKLFDLMMRTPQQKYYDNLLQEEEEKEEEERLKNDSSIDAKDRVLGLNKLRIKKEISELSLVMIEDLNKRGGFHTIVHLIKNAKTLEETPPLYQKIMNLVAKFMAVVVEKEMRSEKQLGKLKKIYNLTPIKAIRAGLAITNPVRLLNVILYIFLSRPWGMHSFMQKFCEILLETKKTEKLLYDAHAELEAVFKPARAQFRKDLLQKIKAYVDAHHSLYHEQEDSYSQTESEQRANDPLDMLQDWKTQINLVLTDTTVSPVLRQDELSQLDEPTKSKLYEVLLLEMRRREKADFIELIGDEKFVSILRELLPIIHTPIANLFCKASIGMHADQLFKTLKRTIKVLERNASSKSACDVFERVRLLEGVFSRFVNDLYAFLHNIIEKDDGTLEKCLKWFMLMWQGVQSEQINLQPLLDSLDEPQYTELCKEVDSLVKYKEWLISLEDEVRIEEDYYCECDTECDCKEEAEKNGEASEKKEGQVNLEEYSKQLAMQPEMMELKVLHSLLPAFVKIVTPKLTAPKIPIQAKKF